MISNTPNFFIVGGAKAGTTSLARYMGEHPDIAFSSIKEPCFFISEKPDSEWVRTWDEYLGLFVGAESAKWRGEASTPYLYYYEEAITQIKNKIDEDCKIIILLRNPVQRAFSMYCHNRKNMTESLEFEEALEMEETRIANKWTVAFFYQGIGFTAKAIKAYQKAFGAQNVGIFFYDDLRQDSSGFMEQVYAFLDVPFQALKNTTIHNTSGVPKNLALYNFFHQKAFWKEPLKLILPKKFRQKIKASVLESNLERPQLSKAMKAQLVELYKGEIKDLEAITGRELSHWTDI